MTRMRRKALCSVCKKSFENRHLYSTSAMRTGIFELVKKKSSKFSEKSRICSKCFTAARAEYVSETLKGEESDIKNLQTEVLNSIKKEKVLSGGMYREYRKKLTFSESLSDKMAGFGGSWKFLISFAIFIAIWIAGNAFLLAREPFDPFPFILLNLVLSCLAAIQAPIIMMSQNRLEARDRLRAEHDYKINLKAELEIRYLHEKLDLLLKNHWNRLMQIQQMQVDVLEEIKKRKR